MKLAERKTPEKASTMRDTPYGWDWTQTTHDARGSGSSVLDISADLVATFLDAGAARALPGKGLQGWKESVILFDSEGFKMGQVYYGGDRTDVHVLSTSAAADRTRPLVAGKFGAKTSRVDTRVDTMIPFEDLAGVVRAAGEAYGSRLMSVESEQRGESLGRTLYLGAPSSAVRVRVYEKWLESPGQYPEGTNRVEVQLRPASKVKERVSGWTPAETFCASRVTRDLAARLGDDMAPVNSLHVKRGTPDIERTLRVMGGQYGRAVHEWLEYSGGDVGKVLDYLAEGAAR